MDNFKHLHFVIFAIIILYLSLQNVESFPQFQVASIVATARNIFNTTISGRSISLVKLDSKDTSYVRLIRNRLKDLDIKDNYRFSSEHLARWLRYTDYNLNNTEKLLRNSIKWRTEKKINNIMNWTAPDYIKTALPYYMIGHSKENNPVIYIPFGKWDFRKIRTQEHRNKALTWMTQLLEKGLDSTRNLTYNNHPVSQVVWIVDFEGISVKKLFNGLGVLSEALKIQEDNFPLLKRNEFFVQVPFIQKATMSAVLAALRPIRRNFRQIRVFSRFSTRMRSILANMIPNEAIPTNLGGSYKI